MRGRTAKRKASTSKTNKNQRMDVAQTRARKVLRTRGRARTGHSQCRRLYALRRISSGRQLSERRTGSVTGPGTLPWELIGHYNQQIAKNDILSFSA